ncbi:MAG: ATP-binding protein [Bacteroidales bacterium]|jgi:hypothetical protein|nr:ATP-binding protein [Bacteroidales bacterium]
MEKEVCTERGEMEQKAVKKSSINLLETIETIIETTEKSKLDEVLVQKTEPQLQALAQELSITPNQALLFSAIVNFSANRRASVSTLARFFDCKETRLFRMDSDFEELKKRKLIGLKRSDDNDDAFIIPKDVMISLKKNEVYEGIVVTHDIETLSDWFDAIDDCMAEVENNSNRFHRNFERERDSVSLEEEIHNLLRDYSHFEFVKKLQRSDLNRFDTLVFIYMCRLFIYDDDDSVGFSDLEDFFENTEQVRLKNFFKQRSTLLFAENLVEFAGDGEVSKRSAVRLTDTAKEEFLAELNLKYSKRKKDFIVCENIVEKPLFYNEKEGKQVGELQKLLSPDYFASVQERMKGKGLPQGFACLFYGSPGTGKTESVLQLAKQSGRDIYMVDIAATKSMWFGESEKKIKEIFVRYKGMVKNSKITPILLFNEADAVFGKRKDISSSNVAQTENAIQNIILQEMETLNGILIATTNLTNNLDAAFERRFVYKIKFEKPSVIAKQKIWQSKMPHLFDEESMRLANKYDFSGGEIDNIVRKTAINEIIFGNTPQFSDLETLCAEEKITTRTAVGFR